MVVIIFFFVILNINLGYKKISFKEYDESGVRNIELGVPKLSFMTKVYERSYSFKSIRNNKVLTKEVKDYIKTLKPTECEDTTYYYDKENNFTIIDYSVKNHFIYNTISYRIYNGDYCFIQKVIHDGALIGGIRRYHCLNSSYPKLSSGEQFKPFLAVCFLDDTDMKEEEFKAEMSVSYVFDYPKITDDESKYEKILEESKGTFEIKDNKVYYTRTEIKKSASDVTIPAVSVFSTENENMILLDDYLSAYDSKIVLVP